MASGLDLVASSRVCNLEDLGAAREITVTADEIT